MSDIVNINNEVLPKRRGRPPLNLSDDEKKKRKATSQRNYLNKNPEIKHNYWKEYRETHREKINAIAKKCYAKKRDLLKSIMKEETTPKEDVKTEELTETIETSL